jgi:hypothetical protein
MFLVGQANFIIGHLFRLLAAYSTSEASLNALTVMFASELRAIISLLMLYALVG